MPGEALTPPQTPRRANTGKNYQYSENGQNLLTEKTEKITEGVFKAAESKAKSQAKNKNSIEVSEDHFRDAIDFILKNGTRSVAYWLFRATITLLASFGGLLALEGYRQKAGALDRTSWLMIIGGVVVAVLAFILDKILQHKA